MMRTGRVLVAYASKNGSTREIAEWVAAELRRAGFVTDVLPADRVREVARYEAVVLGAALYMGRWHVAARHFVRRHRVALRERPVWLFSSGPLDASADDLDIAPVPAAARAMAELHAVGHVTFGGCLGDQPRGWIARRIAAQGRSGDFRNRERVVEWAGQIATVLGAVPTYAR